MGGGGGGEQRAAAEKSYQLQLQQFEFQKQQLAELEEKEKGKKAAEHEILLQLLRRKRTGRRATILTDKETLEPPKPTSPQELAPIWTEQQKQTAVTEAERQEWSMEVTRQGETLRLTREGIVPTEFKARTGQQTWRSNEQWQTEIKRLEEQYEKLMEIGRQRRYR